jgi:uncharacterized protein
MQIHSLKKKIYFIFGLISLSLGILGVVLPLLPTTPLLLLASVCFIRSSEKMYKWLINHKIFGSYLYCYLKYKAIPKATKTGAAIFLWSTLGVSILIIPNVNIKLLLMGVGIGVSIHIASLKTLSIDDLATIYETDNQ